MRRKYFTVCSNRACLLCVAAFTILSSLNFILETLKDEISLHIFELFYLLLVLKLIVLHCATDIMRTFLGVEHVGA